MYDVKTKLPNEIEFTAVGVIVPKKIIDGFTNPPVAVTVPANVAFCKALIVNAVVLPVCNCNTPDESAVCIIPLILDALMVDAIFYPYSITQRDPLGTVTNTVGVTVCVPDCVPDVVIGDPVADVESWNVKPDGLST